MKDREFSKQELVKMLLAKSVKEKVSMNDLSEIVFDAQFPNELFANAKDELIKANDDNNRFIELHDIVMEKLKKMSSMQKEILQLSDNKSYNQDKIEQLKKEIAKINQEVSPMENELLEIKARINERTGKK